jgi:hypothetical protein
MVLFIPLQRVNAAAGPDVWVPRCVPFVHCSDSGVNTNCQPINNDVVHTSSHWGHRAQLDFTGITLPPNNKVVLIECIRPYPPLDEDSDNEDDWYCTTGFSETDKQFYCPNGSTSASCDVKTQLNQNPKITYGLAGDSIILPDGTPSIAGDSYGIYHKTNANLNDVTDPFRRADASTQITTDINGKPSISYAEMQTYTRLAFRKYLLYYVPQQPAAQPADAQAGLGGQQQGTLQWPTSYSIAPETCDFVEGWDPYGRVFDAISLEPIPNVMVSLNQKTPEGPFDANYAKSRNPLIINPFISGASGDFAFFVEDGDYSLAPSIAGYTHPLLTGWTTKGNAASIYSDFYLSDSPAIQQRGKAQHRDIPVMPADNQGKYYDLVSVSATRKVDKNGALVFAGTVSHPFAEVLVEVCNATTGTEVCGEPTVFGKGKGGADNEGVYSVSLDQSKLQPGDYYKRSFRKVDLQSNQSVGEAVGGAAYSSIPSYIEGYAYDSNNNLITQGFAGIYLQAAQVPHAVAPIDSTGRFMITSEQIPKEPYVIKYLRQEGDAFIPISELTIEDFLKQNNDFFTAEGIELYKSVTAATNPRRDITPSFVPQQQSAAQVHNRLEPTPTVAIKQDAQPAAEKSNSALYLVGAILFILIGGGGALVAYRIYRKPSTDI